MYIIAWRYNNQVFTCHYNSIVDAIERLVQLKLFDKDASLHIRG